VLAILYTGSHPFACGKDKLRSQVLKNARSGRLQLDISWLSSDRVHRHQAYELLDLLQSMLRPKPDER
jgi:hypothetical protein